MDEERNIGLVNENDVDQGEQDTLLFPSSSSSTRLKTIFHYILIIFLFIILSFYMFFLTTIVVEKAFSSGNFDFPFKKALEKNQYLHKSHCLTVCNLENEMKLDFLVCNENFKHCKNFNLSPFNKTKIHCITVSKLKNSLPIEKIGKFTIYHDREKENNIDNISLDINDDSSTDNNNDNNIKYIRKTTKKENTKDDYHKFKLSMIQHIYGEQMDSYSKIMDHKLLLKSYNSKKDKIHFECPKDNIWRLSIIQNEIINLKL
ncbi:hypothetical protein CYY_001985 [Polysphondylium violaceum]|uniref:Uncharacterized protein n=1 Tax=Polysphondylium violaceum TaxID=133409 RepID=A0A8J4PXH7_9MYCE|nr:hypothetical protein CYY_001985 [Polysphondylium violaceum]